MISYDHGQARGDAVERTCIGCGQTDDHPRHVIALPDGSVVTWHMDCHKRASGCQVCSMQLEGVEPGTVGEELRSHLLSLPPQDLGASFEES